MKNHYDVCVAGFWYGANYGSLLNGYAEYCLFKETLGKEVLMLKRPMFSSKDVFPEKGHNIAFLKKYYDPEDLSPELLCEELGTLNDVCDCFCAGSDQVWNYQMSFRENMYLPFAADDKKLISFATSFGHQIDFAPLSARPRLSRYFRRFSAISVREQFGVDLLYKNYGIKGELVFEPVFCIDKQKYYDMAKCGKFDVKEPYILTYILDPTPKKIAAIRAYSELLGIRVINILDGQPSGRKRNIEAMDLPNTYQGVSAEDFLQAYANAEFVLTDSFHGMAFSLIFNKAFLVIANRKRGIARFYDMLGRVQRMDRLVPSENNIPVDISYTRPIDYTVTNQIIEREVAHTVEWLRKAVETDKDKLPSVEADMRNPQMQCYKSMVTDFVRANVRDVTKRVKKGKAKLNKKLVKLKRKIKAKVVKK